MSGERKTRGRQKIEMKKMINESNLQVTFSKRRSGLFKKANELCTLCGANVVLVVFSPGGKVFSFGHPNIVTIINRYLTQVSPPNDGTIQFIEANCSANVRELNEKLTQATNQLEVDKKHHEQLKNMRKATQTQFLWARPVEDMNTPQLEALKEAFEELKKDLATHVDMHIIQRSSPIQPPFYPSGARSSSNIPLNLPPPPPTQMFPPPEFFQNPAVMEAHLYDEMMCHLGCNNMGAYGFF